MNSQIHRMTPLLPEEAGELQDLALEVLQKSAALGNRQHSVTLNTLRDLLRIIKEASSLLGSAPDLEQVFEHVLSAGMTVREHQAAGLRRPCSIGRQAYRRFAPIRMAQVTAGTTRSQDTTSEDRTLHRFPGRRLMND